MLRNFDELIERVKDVKKKTVALIAADDVHALQAILEAKDIVDCILVGDRGRICEALRSLGQIPANYEIVENEREEHPSVCAARLIQSGRVDFLMKGKIMTSDMLKGVLKPESGLRTGRLMSHIALNQIRGFHKLLGMTDGGMCPHPDLEQKKQILANALELFHILGYETPKVGVLCAAEAVSPGMPETEDAAELKRLNDAGEISGCIVEGPISYDIAMYPEIAKYKGYTGVCSGEFDILLVPNVVTGNALGKCLVYTVGGEMAGIVMGAKVPIVLTSRASSASEKYNSLALAAGICR
ncbi:MAG: phosphate butyryltransferase [Eubacteriales bacterium]|nr:phosphate butyryltransferase [Eubacteriales bacterium]